MKMLVFERPFQRDLPEPCQPTNDFYRGPKVLSLKNCQPQKILHLQIWKKCLYRNRDIFVWITVRIRYFEFETEFDFFQDPLEAKLGISGH